MFPKLKAIPPSVAAEVTRRKRNVVVQSVAGIAELFLQRVSQIHQSGGLKEISLGQRPRYRFPAGLRPEGTPENCVRFDPLSLQDIILLGRYPGTSCLANFRRRFATKISLNPAPNPLLITSHKH